MSEWSGKAADRENYAFLRHRQERNDRKCLQDTLDQSCARIAALQKRIFDATLRPQTQPNSLLQRILGARSLAGHAANEFDALNVSLSIARIGCTRTTRTLVITTATEPEMHITVNLANGSVEVDQPILILRDMAVRSVCAALVAAGELDAVVALVAGHAPLSRSAAYSRPQFEPRARQGYIAIRSEVLMRALVSAPSQQEVEQQLRVCAAELEAELTHYRLLQQALRQFDRSACIVSADYGREFDLLCELPGVRRIEVLRGGPIRVETEPVIVSYSGASQLLGCYRIEITVSAAPHLTIINLDRPVWRSDRRYDHPHVADGVPCWGNAASYVAQELAAANYPAVVQQSVEFLNSYNPDNPFLGIENWFSAGSSSASVCYSYADDGGWGE